MGARGIRRGERRGGCAGTLNRWICGKKKLSWNNNDDGDDIEEKDDCTDRSPGVRAHCTQVNHKNTTSSQLSLDLPVCEERDR